MPGPRGHARAPACGGKGKDIAKAIMARPRKPSNVLELRGAFNKNPNRKRPNEPKPIGTVGDYSLGSVEPAEIWEELKAACPQNVLTQSDRLAFEIAVELNGLILPGMQKRKWGRVCHISSISAMENHGPVPYCAMKAALTAYTRSMGGVVAPDGVVMTAVLPGAVFTEGGYWDTTLKERPEHVAKYLSERQRIGRFGRPEEIGDYVAYLCSEIASFNTGSIVPIDGGQGRGYFGQ